jgi:hypothetical protein
MGQIKISQLTPKDAPLSNTDLFVIAQATSDDYESKSITGAEIIESARDGLQRELISGENIKTINSTSLLGSGNIVIETNPKMIGSVVGSGVMGTTNQISASVLIPSGTISTNNTIYIKSFIDRTVVSGAGSSVFRFYFNNSNSLTGATFLGSAASMSSTNRFQRFERNIFFDGTNLNLYGVGTNGATDYNVGVISLIGFNPAVDNYLIFAVQHSTSLTDVASWKKTNIQLYD